MLDLSSSQAFSVENVGEQSREIGSWNLACI